MIKRYTSLQKRLFYRHQDQWEKGFSLIELLIVMTVLLIILLAFTPLLVSSIEILHYAGDKSEALYLGQSEMELSIVEKLTVEGSKLEFDYGDTVITVPGGLVEVEKQHGTAQTWLSGFVPYVPTINLFLDPLPLVEGYGDHDIIIMGRDTAFVETDAIKIFKSNGEEVASGSFKFPPVQMRSALPADYDDLDIPVDYDQYGVFTLSSGNINAFSPYMVEVEWVIDADHNIEGKARSRLQIVLPYAVTAGSGQSLWVSSDAGESWSKKVRDFSGVGTINDITWTGFEYVAVTDNGSLITWSNNKPALRSDWFGGISLQATTSGSGLLVAVGSNQTIISSWNLAEQASWRTVTLDNDCTFYDVAWSDQALTFMAVGSNGSIYSSTDGETWQGEVIIVEEEANDDTANGGEVGGDTGEDEGIIEGEDDSGGGNGAGDDEGGDGDGDVEGETVEDAEVSVAESGSVLSNLVFYGVVYGNGTWLAVGEDSNKVAGEEGVIYIKTASAWEEVDTGETTGKALYCVAYGDSLGFMAVGKDGTVLTSPCGLIWQAVEPKDENENLLTFGDYHAVIRDETRGRYIGSVGDQELYYQYIVVGDSGLILTKSDGLTYWEDYSITTDTSLKGVSVR